MNQKMLGIYADIINNLFGFAVISTPPKSKLLSRSPLIFLSVAKAYKCTSKTNQNVGIIKQAVLMIRIG